MQNLIEKYQDRLPKSYLEFMSANKRFSGYLNDEMGYVDIWDKTILHEVFESICEQFEGMGRDWFPIGSNGGGETICIRLTSSLKELYFIPAISISDQHADLYCGSFSQIYEAILKHSGQ
jgi:hypothetical protein